MDKTDLVIVVIIAVCFFISGVAVSNECWRYTIKKTDCWYYDSKTGDFVVGHKESAK